MTRRPETIGELIDRAAHLHGSRPWLWFGDEVFSFAELRRRADFAAAAFLALGVRPGDRVAFVAHNSPDLIFQWFGLNKIGAVFVPLNPDSPADDLAGPLRRAAPSLLVVGPGTEAGSEFEGTVDLNEVAMARQPLVAQPSADPDDVVVFIATSGTTGESKMVMHTHRSFLLTGEGFPWWLGLDENDRLMTSLPLFHINAQAYSTLGSISAGAGLVLLPGFSASRFWQQAADYGATEVNAIGAMIEILMQRASDPAERRHSVRLIYTAPALTRDRHLEVEERFGTRLIYGYGLSESTYGAVWPLDARPYGSMGRLRQHPELGEVNHSRIVDDYGTPVAAGSVGELLLRNPAVMKGYYEMPDATAATLAGGWLHTGDLVRADDDGYLYFVSRKKHLIRRRGENLAPAEVEQVLESHPAVTASAVIGIPSELSDEEVKAFVVVEDPGANASELLTWCRERLAAFKVPRYVEFVAELPRTPTNRVAKHRLSTHLTGLEYDAEGR